MRYDITETRLENGLTLYHAKVPADDVTVLANINARSLYETDHTAGMSHLIEHMLFKGTSKRLSRKEVYQEFGEIGSDFFCHTDDTSIPLGLRVMPESFEQTLEPFSDLLYHSRMDAESVEKEKEIIIDEIRNGEDDPYRFAYQSFCNKLKEGCPAGRPIIGFEHTVKQWPIGEITEFYRRHFNPANTTLFVVGPIEFKDAAEKVKQYFSYSPEINQPNSIQKFKMPRNRAIEILMDRKLSNVQMFIGKLVPRLSLQKGLALKLLVDIMGVNISDAILNKDPISYSRWATSSNEKAGGAIITYAAFDPKNYKRVKELIREEMRKASEGEISEDTFRSVLRTKRKEFVLDYSTTMEKAKLLRTFWKDYSVYDVNPYWELLESVRFEDVRAAGMKHVTLDNLTELCLGRPAK